MTDDADSRTRREVLKTSIGVAAGIAAVNAPAAEAKSAGKFRVAVTGDFERLAMKVAPWNSLGDDVDVVVFSEPFKSPAATVKALHDFDLDVIAAGHCTGWRAMSALANAFGDTKLAPLAVGKQLRF